MVISVDVFVDLLRLFIFNFIIVNGNRYKFEGWNQINNIQLFCNNHRLQTIIYITFERTDIFYIYHVYIII